MHPGYGFLRENAGFAEAWPARASRSLGRRPDHMRALWAETYGARDCRRVAAPRFCPAPAFSRPRGSARAEAARIAYPVMLKSTAGGGGIGMRLCRTPGELSQRYASWRGSRRSNFGDGGCFLRSSWGARAISKCKSSATATGASSRLASAIVRCSAATRKSSRKRRRRI